MDSKAEIDDLKDKKLQPHIKSVLNDDLKPRDMMSLITATISQVGLVGHNISGYDDLVLSGIPNILTQLFKIDRMTGPKRNQTEEDRKITSHQICFNFNDVKIGFPMCTTYLTGQFTNLYPAMARLTGLPYSGPITMGATVILKSFFSDGHVEQKTAEIPSFQVGTFPTMVGGVNCHTTNLPKAALREIGEDSSDPKGHFIIKRGEYIVEASENIKYNSEHRHKDMKPNERVRVEFLSQPGATFENSSQIVIRYMKDDKISIEINSTKFAKVRIPFYIIFRLFGMTDDKTITETIVFDTDDTTPTTVHMLSILEKAFHLSDPNFMPLINELNHEKLVQLTAERISKHVINPNTFLSNENAIQYLNEDLLGSFSKPGGLDKVLLPHMGQTAASRIRKLRFIGLLIHKLLLVHLNVLPPTDRDAYSNKRIHVVSLAKVFKTQANINIVIPIWRALQRELKNNPWASITEKSIIDAFRNSLTTSDLSRALEQSITSGSKTIVVKQLTARNRVPTQALERKNGLNVVSSERNMTSQSAGSASKATDRADKMRRVQPGFVGFACISQSADSGEKVGMSKQLAITASICIAGDLLPLKLLILSDETVVPLDSIPSSDLLRYNYSRIFVGGEWVGCCLKPYELVEKYRLKRRETQEINPQTGIYWDPITNEISFWMDAGRLTRPLLIVDNNTSEYDDSLRAIHEWSKIPNNPAPKPEEVEFIQNIRFTKAHVRGIIEGKLSLDDLIKEGIVEYITAEEQENCLIAESIKNLKKYRNDITMQYSHCDVEQAIFGLAALMSPYGNHTQPARVTYETNQGRQAGGWYCLNFPQRTDKNRFFQFHNEIPLVSTLTHRFVPANGVNTIIAYASYGGDNQEDSAIVNQASADRGLFAGAFFRCEIVELEKNETFCTPNPIITKNLKPNASYEKIVDGFIKVGSIVKYGDVLVGRVLKLNRSRNTSDDKYQYTDRSVVYRLHEPALVEAVLKPRGANDELFCIVKLLYERPLRTGSKLSSRSGNKSIVAKCLPQSDMPFTESGMTPDIIINTHSFPSRMTIGQLIETSQGKICASKGVIADGTAFLPVDHYEIAKELKANGYRFNGRERMYDGKTGEYMNMAIFIGPTTEQCLQKFVLDDEQVVGSSGPTDATTGQPLGGKNVQGGLRIGEMEKWAFSSHGSMLNLFEKSHTDSDGRVIYICRGCGNTAVYNEYHNIYQCNMCTELADISTLESSKSAILLREELAAGSINIRYGLTPRQFGQIEKTKDNQN